MPDDQDAEPTIDLDIPPQEVMPADLGVAPTATDDVATFTYAEPMDPDHREYFDDVRIQDEGLTRGITLTMTTAQMRRWVDLFRRYVQPTERALDSKFGEAWAMYAVTIERWPPGWTSDPDLDPDETDRDPITSRTVATCWTERAAFEVRQSVMAGEHPDFDPLDIEQGDARVRIDAVPLVAEDDPVPWGDGDA